MAPMSRGIVGGVDFSRPERLPDARRRAATPRTVERPAGQRSRRDVPELQARRTALRGALRRRNGVAGGGRGRGGGCRPAVAARRQHRYRIGAGVGHRERRSRPRGRGQQPARRRYLLPALHSARLSRYRDRDAHRRGVRRPVVDDTQRARSPADAGRAPPRRVVPGHRGQQRCPALGDAVRRGGAQLPALPRWPLLLLHARRRRRTHGDTERRLRACRHRHPRRRPGSPVHRRARLSHHGERQLPAHVLLSGGARSECIRRVYRRRRLVTPLFDVRAGR